MLKPSKHSQTKQRLCSNRMRTRASVLKLERCSSFRGCSYESILTETLITLVVRMRVHAITMITAQAIFTLFKECHYQRPHPNRYNIHVPSACHHQSIHAQALITVIFLLDRRSIHAHTTIVSLPRQRATRAPSPGQTVLNQKLGTEKDARVSRVYTKLVLFSGA